MLGRTAARLDGIVMLLYPRNSHLSDIPPDFRGQPYKQWLRDEKDANFERRARHKVAREGNLDQTL